MRNLLEEFYQNHGKHKPSILGVREHVFTGRCCFTRFLFSRFVVALLQ